MNVDQLEKEYAVGQRPETLRSEKEKEQVQPSLKENYPYKKAP